MRKIKAAMLVMMVGGMFWINLAQAQGTILPEASKDNDCNKLLNSFQTAIDNKQKVSGNDLSSTLGCAITTGRISLAMVPYFIQYFSNFLLGLVSLISLLFVVIGGYLYTVGGLSNKKEQGKEFIKNALIGMVIAFLAWTIVSVVIAALTG